MGFYCLLVNSDLRAWFVRREKGSHHHDTRIPNAGYAATIPAFSSDIAADAGGNAESGFIRQQIPTAEDVRTG